MSDEEIIEFLDLGPKKSYILGRFKNYLLNNIGEVRMFFILTHTKLIKYVRVFASMKHFIYLNKVTVEIDSIFVIIFSLG